MTRDEILAMAREAGLGEHLWLDPKLPNFEDEAQPLERFAALVAARERELCAKVREEHAELMRKIAPFTDTDQNFGQYAGARACETLIRRRAGHQPSPSLEGK